MEMFKEEGHVEGRVEGRMEGEINMGMLMSKLYAAGREGDALRAISDADYRNRLYREFGLA